MWGMGEYMAGGRADGQTGPVPGSRNRTSLAFYRHQTYKYDTCKITVTQMTNPTDASATGLYPPLTAMDFHVLLVLAEQDLHGYGIMKEVETQSAGHPDSRSIRRAT